MNIALTGCTRGIGRALVEKWIDQGHTLHGCGRDPEAIASLQKDYPHPHSFTQIDITNANEVEAWAKSIFAQGELTLIIQNAAILLDPQPLVEVQESDLRKLVEVNIFGTHNVTQAFLPRFIKQGSGQIVYLSSGAGRTGLPGIGAYCMTKWALEGYVKSLACELPEGVSVFALSPGMVNTDMLQQCYPDSAHENRNPKTWAKTAAPYILSLNSKDNGESLTTP